MPTVILTEQDIGRRVVVSPGAAIMLRLPENPTSGFRWHADSEPPDGMALEDDSFEAPSPMQPGAAGQRVFSFRVQTAGQVRLRAKLWRAWEGEKSVTARHEFPIEVTTL